MPTVTVTVRRSCSATALMLKQSSLPYGCNRDALASSSPLQARWCPLASLHLESQALTLIELRGCDFAGHSSPGTFCTPRCQLVIRPTTCSSMGPVSAERVHCKRSSACQLVLRRATLVAVCFTLSCAQCPGPASALAIGSEKASLHCKERKLKLRATARACTCAAAHTAAY